MKMTFKGPLMAAGLLFLGGCGAAFDYEGLRSQSFEGKRFENALAREYQTFALFEADQMYDWPDAAHFGKKAVTAGAGAPVPPEALADWRIPSSNRAELIAARTDLLQYLGNGAPKRFPDLAAKMQASFDCWIEQQEENWQTDHIAACRKAFYAAMTGLESKAELRAPLYPSPLKIPARGTDAQTPAGPNGASNIARHTLTFDLDSARIGDDGLAAIDDIARALAENKTTILIVHGHADRSGGEPYNMTLSARRADEVRRAFIAKGIDPSRITTRAHGESRPQVATPDGVKEFRNRRVEIFSASGPAF